MCYNKQNYEIKLGRRPIVKIAILTDTNSGIMSAEAAELGIYVMPMPFFIDGKLYFEGVNLTQEEFFKMQENDAEISTSMPSPADVMDQWDQLLKEHDQVLYLPMSSGLSSSCATAESLAQDYDGRVLVVDNKRISVPLREAIYNAMELRDKGLCGQEIKRILEADAQNAKVFIAVSTLKYLKKGGRVTPAAALIGTALNIKPVLMIDGGKLDAFAKVRGMKQAEQKMIDAAKAEIERYDGAECLIRVAYSGDPQQGQQWVERVKAAFPGYEVYGDPLGLSVCCHTGPGAYGITCIKKLRA